MPEFADERGSHLTWELSDSEQEQNEGNTPWIVLVVFGIPLVVLAAALIAIVVAVSIAALPFMAVIPAGRRKLRSAWIGLRHPATIEIENNPLAPGETVNAALVMKKPLVPESLEIRLVCEEVATYSQGTSTYPDEHAALSETVAVLRGEELGSERGVIRFTFEVPIDAMHSFAASNNRIEWRLEADRHYPNASKIETRGAVQVLPVELLAEVIDERLSSPPPADKRTAEETPRATTVDEARGSAGPFDEPERARRDPYRRTEREHD